MFNKRRENESGKKRKCPILNCISDFVSLSLYLQFYRCEKTGCKVF